MNFPSFWARGPVARLHVRDTLPRSDGKVIDGCRCG